MTKDAHSKIKEYYSKARPIPSALFENNKYAFLGYNNIVEIGYLDINDIIQSNKSDVLDSYISRFGQVLLFPNRINGEIVNLFIRPLNEKTALLKLGNSSFPYNMGNLAAGFKFGDPIILVEGIADLGALKLLDPSLNIIAMQSVSIPNEYYVFLQGLTDKVIILNDNDKAGNIAKFKTAKTLQAYKITPKIVDQYAGLKDTGDILDKMLLYLKTKRQDIKEELELIKLYYLSQLREFN